MASSIFNTVWSSIFEPLPTFGFLDRSARSRCGAPAMRRTSTWSGPASGVVVQVGSAVRNWKPGDRVVVHCNFVDQDPSAHDDSMLAANQRIWGFESNYGGLADLAVVKANQVMPKPAHLTWEEAAVNGLCASTSYRMLVGRHAARMKQGDNVFIWGATGGIGALRDAARPQRRWHAHRRGVERGPGPPAPSDGLQRRRPQGRGLQVLEGRAHPGRGRVAQARQEVRASWATTPTSCSSTPGARRWVPPCSSAKRGGTIVTWATSGFMIEYDNRHLWMKLKRIVSSHFANYREAWR